MPGCSPGPRASRKRKPNSSPSSASPSLSRETSFGHCQCRPLTPDLRRLNVTVSAPFRAELEQVRAALSHKCPGGNFEQVVREAFKLVLERDRKRKALTDRPRPPTDRPRPPTDLPRAQPEDSGESDRATSDNARYVPAAVKRTVWERDKARCTWP